MPKVRIAAALAELCGTRTGCGLAALCGVTGQGQQVLPVGIEMYQLSFPALRFCFLFFFFFILFSGGGMSFRGKGQLRQLHF